MSQASAPIATTAKVCQAWESTQPPQPPALSRRKLLSLAAASATPFIATSAYSSTAGGSFQPNAAASRGELSLVVPYPAAGPLDRIARRLTQQTAGVGRIQVMNVPSESGAAGPALVSRAGARDPMLLMGAVGTLAILPWLNPQIPYDPLRDFQPLTLVAHMPHVLVMRSELALQWRIYGPEDLLRVMAKQRQPLRYASAGRGTIGHIAGQWFQSLTQAPLQHLPFSGIRPALSAVLEGSADLMFDNIASALPHIRAGRLKAIGVTSSKPPPALPQVPSLGDSVQGLNLTTWFGLFATAGITDAQARHWSNAFAQALQAPQMQQYLDSMGVIRADLRLQDFSRFVQQEHSHYGKLLKAHQLLGSTGPLPNLFA